MASEKNERLINLVIALMASKRFWSKEQIFDAVEGYNGSSDANDRMFERDKEELRALGIEIEMKSIDPLFDDEIGYRITPDRYRFDLGPLNSQEISILALAAEAWRESALADTARSTALRLESLGINSDFSQLPLLNAISYSPDNLSEVLETLNSNRMIEFEYLNLEDVAEKRLVEPHGIYSQDHRWYLYAYDPEQKGLRSFRLDRIVGTIKRNTRTFERRHVDLPMRHFPSVDALIQIRRDYAPDLIGRGELISDDDEWSTWRITFNSESEAISRILRNSPNVKVLEPISLVASVNRALDELVHVHG